MPKWPRIKFADIDQVLDELSELKRKGWYSRGLPQQYGGLIPSIDRGKRDRLSRSQMLRLERESLALFRSNVQFLAPGEEPAFRSDLIGLMVIRHYGVPTRLLDWSQSPYVAAFFAVQNFDNHDGEIWSFCGQRYLQKGTEQWSKYPETTTDGSGDPAKFDLSLNNTFASKEPNPWIVCNFYPPRGTFPRQDAQEGLYSMTAQFGRDHAKVIRKLLKGAQFQRRFVIPKRMKPELRLILQEKYGICRGALFPDVAGAAETVRIAFEKSASELLQKVRRR